MKRCLQTVVFSVLLCGMAFVFTQAAMAAQMIVTDKGINDTGVNFRAEASLESHVIRSLGVGVSVEVMEHDPAGWSKARHDGTVGYIRSDFLTVPTGSEYVIFITTDDVNFRTGPSLDDSVIMSVEKGSSVEVLKHDPAGWSEVRVNGTVGYIRSDFLALPIQNAQQTSDTSVQISTSTQTTLPAQSATTLKTIDGVNFRTGPSTDAGIIGTLNANTSVDVLEHYPSGWSKVMANGSVGYIRSDLLSISGRNVELLDWSVVRSILTTGVPIRVYDVRTGLSYNIICFSKGDHADVDPVTRADTEAKLNSRSGVWSWAARPVWVTIGDRTIAASINGMPHASSSIPDNGLNGHFCLHFLGSTTSSTSASYKADLQNAVMEAWNAR